jgi:hypothetical protein
VFHKSCEQAAVETCRCDVFLVAYLYATITCFTLVVKRHRHRHCSCLRTLCSFWRTLVGNVHDLNLFSVLLTYYTFYDVLCIIFLI